jgi:hypothetical protein
VALGAIGGEHRLQEIVPEIGEVREEAVMAAPSRSMLADVCIGDGHHGLQTNWPLFSRESKSD